MQLADEFLTRIDMAQLQVVMVTVCVCLYLCLCLCLCLCVWERESVCVSLPLSVCARPARLVPGSGVITQLLPVAGRVERLPGAVDAPRGVGP